MVKVKYTTIFLALILILGCKHTLNENDLFYKSEWHLNSVYCTTNIENCDSLPFKGSDVRFKFSKDGYFSLLRYNYEMDSIKKYGIVQTVLVDKYSLNFRNGVWNISFGSKNNLFISENFYLEANKDKDMFNIFNVYRLNMKSKKIDINIYSLVQSNVNIKFLGKELNEY